MTLRALLFLVLSLSFVVHAENLIVEETVVESWGFKTIENSDDWQLIKGTKRLDIRGNTYYARYVLSKKCFNSDKAALEKVEFNQAQKSNSKDEFRGTFIAAGNCLFNIAPYADIFKYYDRSNVVTKFKKYVRKGT